MPPKHPKLKHVRYVPAKGKTYAYFDTGKRKPNGRPIYTSLPPPGSVGFFDSYAAMVGARTKREKKEYTVSHLIRDYEKSAAFRDLAENTQTVYSLTLRSVGERLGDYPVLALTSDDIQLILDNEEMGAGAHNMFIAVIGAMYKWRWHRDKSTPKPTEGMARRKSVDHKPWPDHVVEAALSADSARIRLAVHLLYFTGQRIGDMVKMRWSDIRDGVIEIEQEKTGKTVWVPLISELADELARTAKVGLTILASPIGNPYPTDTIRKELQAFTARLGVKTVPHGLRKNAVNSLLLAGCTVAETASITGQSYKVVEDYAKRINMRGMAKAAIVKLENKRGLRKPDGKRGQEG